MRRRAGGQRGCCAVAGCVVRIERWQTFCRFHWLAIPAVMRAAITSSRGGRDKMEHLRRLGEAKVYLSNRVNVNERES